MAILSQPTAAVEVLPESGEEAAEVLAMPTAAPGPKTYLNISAERMEWLVQIAMQRISEVSREMGRESDGNVTPNSWMAERQRHQDTYDLDLRWRAVAGTVFAESNLTWGDSWGKTRIVSAKMRNDLMGTRPFFSAVTARNGRPILTSQVEAFLQEEIERSNVPETMREAIRTALVRNEAVVKTTYFVDKTMFRGPAKGVFVDASGQPVLTSKGDYVYEKDDVLPDPNVEGLVRLKKDPSFTIEPNQYGLADFDDLPQVSVKYDNVRADVIDHRDFLCPLKVNSIHEADINAHLYHRRLGQLRAEYGDIDADATRTYFDQYGGRTGAEQPILIRGEMDEEQSTLVEKLLIAEVYMRCQVHGDVGDYAEREVMLVLDYTNQKAIFADYLENHMETRPFSVIPGIEKVAGRWYGIGIFSKMSHSELYADAQLNRINKKDGRISSLTIRNKKAVEEWAAGEPCVFGTDKVYNYAVGYNPEQNGVPITRINLDENMQFDMALTESFRRSTAAAFGIQTNQSASVVDNNRSGTATGVMSIERDTDVITSDQEYDVARGLEQVLKQAVGMVLENMDDEVLAWSADGSEIATLNREEIRSLEKDVKLLMTKSLNAETLSTNSAAEAIWTRFMALDPRRQYWGRPMFLRQLKALRIDEADDLLPQVSKEEMEAWMKAQSEQKPEERPASESIAVKYESLAPSEKAQVLLRANIQPAPPAEIARDEAHRISIERLEGAPYPEDSKPEKPAANPSK